MNPVGSISFICDLCSKGISHAHGPALPGGVFSVPAAEWMDTIRRAVDDATTLYDAHGVFYNQGQPICEGHWMDEVKKAVQVQTRVANMSKISETCPLTVADRMSGYAAFHRFYTTRYTTGHPFHGDPSGWVNDLKWVLQDVGAVDRAVDEAHNTVIVTGIQWGEQRPHGVFVSPDMPADLPIECRIPARIQHDADEVTDWLSSMFGWPVAGWFHIKEVEA